MSDIQKYTTVFLEILDSHSGEYGDWSLL